ncbi:MAG: DUF6062 family protein [Eubacteriales bacterium]|nr:DUF6062 family protein [Eubacteriales bacterium]
MKEKLYTIPLNDAVNAGDECPLCYIENKMEEDWLDYTLGPGASYMESDVRGMTDKEGFCRKHFQKMFDYGNTLGNAWILKTHYLQMNRELQAQMEKHTAGAGRPAIFGKFRKPSGDDTQKKDSVAAWVAEKEASCFICRQERETYARYLSTFFYLWEKDPAFRDKIRASKGFCLPHFADLCEEAQGALPQKEQEEFYSAVFDLMRGNMERMAEDVAWLVEKFDYQNKDADWKNSKDAVQRGMQKLKGGYPAQAPYRMKK